jgi:hypothetical protein
MAVNVFHTDARGFGLLSSIMAIGTMSGALLAAGGDRPNFGSLLSVPESLESVVRLLLSLLDTGGSLRPSR